METNEAEHIYKEGLCNFPGSQGRLIKATQGTTNTVPLFAFLYEPGDYLTSQVLGFEKKKNNSSNKNISAAVHLVHKSMRLRFRGHLPCDTPYRRGCLFIDGGITLHVSIMPIFFLVILNVAAAPHNPQPQC